MSLTVLVTGANRGIGLSFVKHYCAQGAQVIAVCRQASGELTATSAEVLSGIDMAQADSIAELQSQLAGRKLDIVINNAGIFENELLGQIDYAAIERQLTINALAPLRVTEALLNNLASGSKIAMITSRMGSITDNGSGSYYGYRMSKAALNAASQSLAQDLRGKGIAVAILHPGFVQTDMVGGAGDISADEAATRLMQRIEELNIGNTGTFWHSNGDVLPW